MRNEVGLSSGESRRDRLTQLIRGHTNRTAEADGRDLAVPDKGVYGLAADTHLLSDFARAQKQTLPFHGFAFRAQHDASRLGPKVRRAPETGH